MKSVMKHQFSQVPKATIPRSSFDRSHGVKSTFDAGLLIPIYVDEAVPGDTFSVRLNAFARMATPIHPIMDNLFMETFFFAIPNRLVWSNWQRFMGEQLNPGDSTDFTVPRMQPTTTAEGSLADYFGLPITSGNIPYNSLHHRAYNLVFREWFRDQNLVNAPVVELGDGPDDPTNYKVLRRAKKHDYFTSALPWPQKGPTVNLPLGQTAPIAFRSGTQTGDAHVYEEMGVTGSNRFRSIRSTAPPAATDTSALGPGQIGPLVADLTQASAATINELRQAFQIQKMAERDARGGTRYIEIIRAHFGVVSPDARLQRPEYLGGGSSYININPVAQTSQTNEAGQNQTTPQGNLAAYATASIGGHGFTKSFTEHCLLLGLVNVRADLTYQQGIDRMFQRQTKYDYYWPALSHIGEQMIRNDEIFISGTNVDAEAFGYQERYAEYRYKPSRLCGKFKSAADSTLDAWHLGIRFGTLPALNETFIEDKPPIERVIAAQTEPHFLFDGHFTVRCARPMPLYSVPGMIDHF